MTVENEFSPAFSTAFDASALVDSGIQPCINVDWLACMTAEEYNALEPEQVLLAELFAQAVIQQLSGFQVGMCPIVVRPCIAGCQGSGSIMNPTIRNGIWYNTCGCPAEDCSCTALTKVILDGPVASISQVMLNGAVVSPADYRVDNFNELIRLGGDPWPTCQDMTLANDADGAFTVTYTRGAAMGAHGAVVAGILAKEYLNACNGAECRLPSNVINLSRQGLTMEFGNGVFANGNTGIEVVDIWLAQFNPYKVKSPATVYSPDARRQRQVTWRA